MNSLLNRTFNCVCSRDLCTKHFAERNLQSPGEEKQEMARGEEVSAGGGGEEVKGERSTPPCPGLRGSHDPVREGSGVER